MEFTISYSPCKKSDELASKDDGESFLVKEIVILARDPLFTLFAHSAT